MARVGEMVRLGGTGNGKQIVPENWIADLMRNGSQDAWQRGNMAYMLPDGRYRSKWYQTGNDHGAIFALGIHGQWIYVDPVSEVTVVRTASQPLPLEDEVDLAWIAMFDAIARSYA
jgi:CubicO group peptidase (beta-lactamase class C family)